MTGGSRKSRRSSGKPEAAPAPAKSPTPKRREGNHAGHLDPGHAARLRRLSRETEQKDVDVAFVAEPRSRDETAEQFGEEAVATMTSGEDAREEDRDERAVEEIGGPFVPTSATEEFATGTDETNTPEAPREPFPKTSGGKS
jgi:hypothetical protein